MNILIDFKDSASQTEIDRYLSENNCTILSVFDKFKNVYHVYCLTQPPITSIIEHLEDNAVPIRLLNQTVSMFQSMKEIDIDNNNENNWWKLASIYDVDFQNSFRHKIYGEHVKIYVVDSGIDITHEEFSNSNITNLWSFNNDFTDQNGHGTAIASLLVGKTCGLTDASVQSVKIFDQNQTTYLSDIVSAFNAIANDYNSNQNFGVINLSWAMPRNSFIDSKIETLIKLGLVVVAAAGNDSSPVSEITPAGIEDVFTIGAYNEQFVPCNWSNYTGSSDLPVTNGQVNTGALDGFAPGENIYVALPGNQYGLVSGTSFAAPIHAGAIAYVIDLHCYTVDGNIDLTSFGFLRLKENVELFTFGRRNILTLDYEYAYSLNRITTYPGANHGSVRRIPFNQIGFLSGKNKSVILFYPTNTVSVEILDPLPEGLVITDTGLLSGTVSFDTLLTDKEYITTTHRLKLYRVDGSYDDYNLEITVVDADKLDTLNEDSEWAGILTGINCTNSTCVRGCPARNPGLFISICDYDYPKYVNCGTCLAD